MNTFTELGLSECALNSLAEVGFKVPTAVQEKTIGLVLSGADVIATAQTGTGKTGAYAIPLIQIMSSMKDRRFPATLVLVPTRELALQVKAQFDALGRYARVRCVAIYGGTGYGGQFKALARGADVIVATPGRLNDLINQRAVNLSRVETAVLDEADRLLDMGFLPQVQTILARLPESRQTLMFTATLDERIREISRKYMNAAQLVQCKEVTTVPSLISQQLHHVQEVGKRQLLLDVLKECDQGTVLVFTRTRRKATQVAKNLRTASVRAEEIHGEISQSKRERTMSDYRKGHFKVLVATDIAARGLDVPAITHVVNYDLPQSPEEYVHRIGRTGRAGQTGIAHTFMSDTERHLMRKIDKLIGGRGLLNEKAREKETTSTYARAQAPAKVKTYANAQAPVKVKTNANTNAQAPVKVTANAKAYEKTNAKITVSEKEREHNPFGAGGRFSRSRPRRASHR